MKHASLFSGIGGFDLAAEWAGWENAFHCEWNEFGQKILKYYWPNAISYGDITKTDFTIWRNRIGILTGGFPCQPYSAAGKRRGKDDPRHLWPHMLRAVREIQPGWVVGENVRGLTNWNGGMVFDEVQAELEAEGYEVLPFLLPACAVNAPHRRDRIWFVAHRYNSCRSERSSNRKRESCQQIEKGDLLRSYVRSVNENQYATNPDYYGQLRVNSSNEIESSQRWIDALNDIIPFFMHSNSSSEQMEYIGQKREGKFNRSNSGNGINNFTNFPTQPPVCGGNDGISTGLDGITFPKWRNESIKAYGNAIVPQVAYQIFKAINQYTNSNL